MPRALVTGATGLVGSYIVEQLVRDGWETRALVRGAGEPGAGATPVRGDVLDSEAFGRAADRCDVIFHTAAAITSRGGWEAYRRMNVDGTMNAIGAAERSGARLLQLSSVAVYGAQGRYRADGGKTSETSPLGPLDERGYYARSKRESEQLVLDAHQAGRIWATAVRPDVIYGRRDRQFVPRIARLLRFGVAPVIGSGRSTLAIVHAANVAEGAIRAATSDIAGGRAYNLANDFDVTVRDFYRLAGEGLGRRIRIVRMPVAVAAGGLGAAKAAMSILSGGRSNVMAMTSIAMLTQDNPFTSDRARAELGWSPAVRPADGVPDAFRWWAERGG